jgi:hypothetical protein
MPRPRSLCWHFDRATPREFWNLSLKAKNNFLGSWRITHTEQWDRDYLDLVTTAHITFKAKGQGEMELGALGASIDWRVSGDRIAFSFEGSDEGTPISGRGHAQLQEPNNLVGHLFFHLGDDTAFEATRKSG